MSQLPSSEVPDVSGGAYLEWLWAEWQKDPSSVSERWQKVFQQWSCSSHAPSAQTLTSKDVSTSYLGEDRGVESQRDRLTQIEALIHAYRRFGHLCAHLDPLSGAPETQDHLTLKHHGLDEHDGAALYLTHFSSEPLAVGSIFSALQRTYTSKLGADFQDLYSAEQVRWLQQRMEGTQNSPDIPPEKRRHILDWLARAEGFERFLHKRYLGQKRFSLEGLESLIPVLHTLAEEGAESGAEELCLGMAHRGRLNVLVNFMGKPCKEIFESFEGSEFNPFDIDGDVKYHLGFAHNHTTARGKNIRLFLAPNPSHLEAVNPVIQGFVKARQRQEGDEEQKGIIPVLLHGDGAFVGQGIVAETLNLSQLSGYSTGGTLHIILNNQVGFTTNPEEARSCYYASDVAKFVQAPVLHVNADDPDRCVWAAQLALHYRQTFHRDVVIDLVGYRRHGHNEGDEPAFTQPLMYRKIKKHPTCYRRYLQECAAALKEEIDSLEAPYHAWSDELQKIYEGVQRSKVAPQPDSTQALPSAAVPQAFSAILAPDIADYEKLFEVVETAVSCADLSAALKMLTTIPKGFKPHNKVKKVLEKRRSMLKGVGAVDWATAELLALGTLAQEGHPIRLSGQDVRRGTFSSRHGVMVDRETGQCHEFLAQVGDSGGAVELINSPLSEQGCLGFEYGYAVADPQALVLWEAQFGDFSNGAQIIIDQFLVASEAKWQQVASLVMLLPHGYEGQGPEHSNARPERYLQLCGGGNIQVVSCSTPAQHFHVLRRQALRDFRKCLICLTPKSLLRDPQVTSTVSGFTEDHFQEVLDDPDLVDPLQVRRLIFCSGKIYYEARRHELFSQQDHGIAMVRIEQLYPFPSQKMTQIKERYSALEQVIWMQEEPQNMGAWSFIRPYLEGLYPHHPPQYVGRKTSGSTAEGSHQAHLAEQRRIIEESLHHGCGWEPPS